MADPPLSIERIKELLPHRPPFLMVDRVTEVGDDYIVGEKLVAANEPILQGHFPGRPIMPGVLIVEAVAQLAGLWEMIQHPQFRGRGVALVGIDRARFRRPVVPGDVLRLEAHFLRRRRDVIQFRGSASVDGEKDAELNLLAAFVEWRGDPRVGFIRRR